MSIAKPHLNNYRNAEHYQFMASSHGIFVKHNIDPENLNPCYATLSSCIHAEEQSLAMEKSNGKIREKNEADHYRDKLHSRLYNYVKSIMCDDRDPDIESARAVMNVIREVGNPSHLAENAASAVITTLINRLTAIEADVLAIGASAVCLALKKANSDFIILEKECREITAAQQVSGVLAVTAARKKTDTAYRTVANAINGYAGIPSKTESCMNLVAEMNTLIAKYNALAAGRSDGGDKEGDPGNTGSEPEK